MRERHEGRMSVREIGDLLPIRGERQKARSRRRTRRVYQRRCVSLPLRRNAIVDRYRSCCTGEFPTRSDHSSGGLRFGPTDRAAAAQEWARENSERGEALAGQEPMFSPSWQYVIWKPAFSDEQLFREFRDVLVRNAILSKAEDAASTAQKPFLRYTPSRFSRSDGPSSTTD